MATRGTISVEMDGRTEKLFNDFRKIVEVQSQMETGLRKYGETGDRAGKRARAAFQKATEGVKNHLNALVGIQAMYASVTAAVRELDRVRKESAQNLRESERGLGSLAELSGGDPKVLQRLVRQARQLYGQGGAQTLEGAAQSIYAFESAGLNTRETRRAFGNLYGIVNDTAMLARAIATMQTAMGAEAGKTPQLISKALAANKYAPASAPEILEAASRGAAGAKLLGLSDEEIIAGSAVLAKATGTAEMGGTQLDALLMSLVRREGFKGLSLRQSIERLESFQMTDPELVKFLGRKEALRGFAALRDNMELFSGAVADIDRAQDENLFGKMTEARNRTADIAAAMRERQSKAQLENARAVQGIAELEENTAINQYQIRRELEGGNRLITQLGVLGLRFKQTLASGEEVMETVGTPLERARYREMQEAAREGRPISETWMIGQSAASDPRDPARAIGESQVRGEGALQLAGELLLRASERDGARALNGTPDEDL